MEQKAQIVVIDEFCDAMKALVPRAPAAAIERLRAALSDLLEAFASTSLELGIAPVVSVLQEQEALALKIEAVVADVEAENERIGAIERRSDSRGAQMNDMQIDLDQQAERINTLEEALPDIGAGVD